MPIPVFPNYLGEVDRLVEMIGPGPFEVATGMSPVMAKHCLSSQYPEGDALWEAQQIVNRVSWNLQLLGEQGLPGSYPWGGAPMASPQGALAIRYGSTARLAKALKLPGKAIPNLVMGTQLGSAADLRAAVGMSGMYRDLEVQEFFGGRGGLRFLRPSGLVLPCVVTA